MTLLGCSSRLATKLRRRGSDRLGVTTWPLCRRVVTSNCSAAAGVPRCRVRRSRPLHGELYGALQVLPLSDRPRAARSCPLPYRSRLPRPSQPYNRSAGMSILSLARLGSPAAARLLSSLSTRVLPRRLRLSRQVFQVVPALASRIQVVLARPVHACLCAAFTSNSFMLLHQPQLTTFPRIPSAPQFTRGWKASTLRRQ